MVQSKVKIIKTSQIFQAITMVIHYLQYVYILGISDCHSNNVDCCKKDSLFKKYREFTKCTQYCLHLLIILSGFQFVAMYNKAWIYVVAWSLVTFPSCHILFSDKHKVEIFIADRQPKVALIKSRPASAWLFDTQILWTDNDPSLLSTDPGKAEPLISTAACQKFDFDLWPWAWPWPWPVTLTRPLTLTLTLTLKQGNSDVKTRLLTFDLDIWLTTLTYNPTLAKVKVDLYTEYQGRRSNGPAVRAHTDKQINGRTDRQTDRRTLPSTLSPCFAKATRSIKRKVKSLVIGSKMSFAYLRLK